jgi:hypothetical protein
MSDTSKEAYERVKPVLSLRRLECLIGLIKCGGRATAREIGVRMSSNPAICESIRRRSSDLVRLGFFLEDGVKTCDVSNYEVTAYCINPARENALYDK